MKKGIFNDWFRELATLIFTQTIQAFLLAIVMTIVISAMSSSTTTSNGTNNTDGSSTTETNQNTNTTNYAAGLLAIIALSQFGKIELLVKNIFGVTSKYGGDMDSGRGALTAGKLMAFAGVKSMMDNGKKMIGGGINAYKSSKDIKTLNAKRAIAQDKVNNPEAYLEDNPAITGAVAGTVSGAVVNSGTEGNQASGIGVSAAQIDQLIGAIQNQTKQLQSNSNNNSKEKAQKELDDIDAKIAEAKAKKREGFKNIASGLVENAAIAPSAAVGATVALGFGDSAIEGALGGIAVGDKIASSAVSSVSSAANYRDMIKKTNEQYKKAAKDFANSKNADKVYDNFVKSQEKEYSRLLNIPSNIKGSPVKRSEKKAMKVADKMKDAGNH